MKKELSLFLDSGAFSAFSKGIKIDINEYIAFVKENEKYFDIYANLDVIGDPEATLNNQKLMEKAGLTPLPCFHYGEDIKYLKYYLDKYDYIALGGMVPISTKDLYNWLDYIFLNYICDDKGYPKIKIHGFGMTSFDLMLQFPWYSIDSTSWVLTGRFGSVYVPLRRNGESIYDKRPWVVGVSNQSSDLKKLESKHMCSFTDEEQEVIISYFIEKGYVMGVSEFKEEGKLYKLRQNERWIGARGNDGLRRVEVFIEKGVSNDYKQRDELNIIYFIDLEKNLTPWPNRPYKKKKSNLLGLGLV